MVEKIMNYLIEKLNEKNWNCKCGECLWGEFVSLTDDEIMEVLSK